MHKRRYFIVRYRYTETYYHCRRHAPLPVTIVKAPKHTPPRGICHDIPFSSIHMKHSQGDAQASALIKLHIPCSDAHP